MNSSILRNLPKCSFDQTLEFTPSEIGSVSESINVLLKKTFLIGTPSDLGEAFQSLFDTAEEIVGVDHCAYISVDQDFGRLETVASRRIPMNTDQDPSLFVPVEISRHYGKVIQLDTDKDPSFRSVCDSWQSASLAVFPLRRGREFIGALVFGRKKSVSTFTTTQMKLLWVLSIQAENLLLQEEGVRTLNHYSFLDPLTHLHNRLYFNKQMEKEISRSRRNGKPFALLMIDLDGFQDYNDKFLHSAGDIALQEFASILQTSVREADTVARYGGDEFVLILFESDAEGARDLARRIIERQNMHLFPGRENNRTERLSVSIGAATFPADSFDMQDLINKSYQALSAAKSQGGGKVSIYHEIEDLLTLSPSRGDIPIQKVYNATRSIVDIDAFLEILLFTAMQVLSADRGSIIATNPKGDFTLSAAIGFGKCEEKLTPGSFLTAGAVTNWVMEHGKPLVVSDPGDMPFPKRQEENGYRSDSFLSLPLHDERRMLGVIHLANKRDGNPFTWEHVQTVMPISVEIARILSEGVTFRNNVRLFSTSILMSLANALELRFPFLNGHHGRVVDLSVRIGTKLGLEEAELAALETAAALHDVGIVGIPASFLTSSRRLSDTEQQNIRNHPFLGAKLVGGVPGMENTRRIILEHHEFWNGSGYPYGFKGEQISIAGRILAVAEFYDSITSERPHRGKLYPQEAAQLVRNGMDTLFDRDVCLAFLEG